MDLKELEAEGRALTTTPTDGEVYEGDADSEEDRILADIWDARILLAKAKTLLDYLSDPDSKTITKRERIRMEMLSLKVKEYLEQMDAAYGEDGEA